MILGIGTDITKVNRFESMINKQSFLQKIYTNQEIAYCQAKKKGAITSFAARYAAKEAVMKALGTGYSLGVAFTEIEIVANSKGKPEVVLSGTTQRLAEQMGVKNIHISLTHESEYAVAYVIFEG